MNLATQFQKNCSDGPFVSVRVMEDVREQNQETRQGQRPARMVGLLSLNSALSGMEANQRKRRLTIWQRSEG